MTKGLGCMVVRQLMTPTPPADKSCRKKTTTWTSDLSHFSSFGGIFKVIVHSTMGC